MSKNTKKGSKKRQSIEPYVDNTVNSMYTAFCLSCEVGMTKRYGYENTGLCGVCATGNASMLNEFAESW